MAVTSVLIAGVGGQGGKEERGEREQQGVHFFSVRAALERE